MDKIPNGPAVGKYDPKKAIIMHMARTKSVSGEPKVGPAEYCRRYIRFRSQNAGRESTIQTQATSITVLYIRMARDSKTLTINPSMQIIHRGVTYGITSQNPVDYGEGELEFICQAINPTT